MAYVATHNGHTVSLFCRDAEQAKAINQTHRNPKRMSNVALPDAITATTKFEVAVEGTSLIMYVAAQDVHFGILKLRIVYPDWLNLRSS